MAKPMCFSLAIQTIKMPDLTIYFDGDVVLGIEDVAVSDAFKESLKALLDVALVPFHGADFDDAIGEHLERKVTDAFILAAYQGRYYFDSKSETWEVTLN